MGRSAGDFGNSQTRATTEAFDHGDDQEFERGE